MTNLEFLLIIMHTSLEGLVQRRGNHERTDFTFLASCHWIVLGLRRYTGSDHGPEAWMAIPLLALSVLGVISFGKAGDTPAMILFIGLTLIYITEIPARFLNSKSWEKGTGFFQLINGIWLLYLTYGVTLNLANGMHWWV